MLRSSASNLFADLDVRVTPDAPIGAQTWYGIGGSADMLVHPHSIEALMELARRCRRSRATLRVLGAGANLLVADDGVDGIVVKLDAPCFTETKYEPKGEIEILTAGGGADMARTLMDSARRGLSGLEPMAGIPSSIGGALRMNAGGKYGCIGDVVETVTCISRDGRRMVYPASELRFDYRKTNIPDPIIAEATFRLTPDDPIDVRKRVKDIFQFKQSSQPLAEHTAGCAFKNPIDPVSEQRVSAGKLIDDAKLKGHAVGGASVSTRHANFIVAHPGASAADVMELISQIKQRVFDSAGIELEEEIVIWRREDHE
jgi:UDP-N-acetylmuramate dehydrogenase